MSEVLATVILPTHSDPGTLGYAISSVLNQDERRIELVIVLDGATSKTRTTAIQWAELDSRIRVLDLPKGKGSGPENRHQAVLSAESDAIFYIDEDDLWFPSHVSMMLEKIHSQNADVVCSTVASVTPKNKIEIAPFSHAHGPLRISLREGAYRSLFKIHMCHTKSAYTKLPVGWAPASNGEIVKQLMMALADPKLKWVPIHEVTALSFHGTPRRSSGVSPKSRSLQLLNFSEKIQNRKLRGDMVTKNSSIAYYFTSVVYHLEPPGPKLREYVDLISSQNVTHPEKPWNENNKNSWHLGEGQGFPFTKDQAEVAQSILNHRFRRKVPFGHAWRIYGSLTSVVCGPPIWTKKQGIPFLMKSIVGE